jgi:hypothetical protein
MLKTIHLQSFLSAMLLVCACSDDDDKKSADDTLPAVYEKIYGATDVYLDGDFVVIKTTGLPDHGSPYYTGSGFEAYNGSNPNFVKNPNTIAEQNYTFRIPVNPALASSHAATPLGAIGVSLNGVPFFNQYAGPNQPLTNEINSFDQYNGHPQQMGAYHYHVEPLFLTSENGEDALLGFLLDGFPVYGPMENGAVVNSSGLDAYHGHSHATADFPDGIYHYHISSVAPYINGDGFYGTAGTVTQ